MIPLNLVETFTRTFSLIVRLFGNVMSGVFIIGIVLSLAGLLVPIPLMALELLDRGDPGLHLHRARHGVHRQRRWRRTDRRRQRRGTTMNWNEIVSIFAAAMAVSFGAIGPALGEGRAVAAAMDAIARQPEAAGTISRTLFVGLAMIETMAIYCLVIALLGAVRQPVSSVEPMHIDWWTLALQTVNVLVLIWLLARFFFRPVMDDRRQTAGRGEQAAGRRGRRPARRRPIAR